MDDIEDENIEYDEVEMDPLGILFDKIHKARGGEMFLIHISKFGKKGPSVQVCSVMNKKESAMARLLPSLVEDFLNE
jgi:hypothetical protein